jgi:hypothetical protein
LNDGEDGERPFYRDLDEEEMERLSRVVKALYAWKRWDSPPNDEIDRILFDNESEVRDWFRSHGLTAGYLMGARE